MEIGPSKIEPKHWSSTFLSLTSSYHLPIVAHYLSSYQTNFELERRVVMEQSFMLSVTTSQPPPSITIGHFSRSFNNQKSIFCEFWAYIPSLSQLNEMCHLFQVHNRQLLWCSTETPWSIWIYPPTLPKHIKPMKVEWMFGTSTMILLWVLRTTY